MPFPSLGCNTCRRRHIRCDERRPTCGQCEKSGKECTGFDSEPGGLLFKNENPYASNRSAKRPRGGARKAVDKVRSTKSPPSRSSTREASTVRSSHTPPLDDAPSPSTVVTSLTRQLSIPLEDQAFHYFTRNFIEIPWHRLDGPWGLLNNSEGFEVGPSQPETALNLAATAVSLAIFGRLRNSQEALDQSQAKYSKALLHTRANIGDISQAATDQTLCAVMLLSAYEGRIGHLRRDNLLPEGFKHQEGATALMKLRQLQTKSSERSIELDRQIRRQLLRTHIFQGTPLPPWLHDGAAFGETGPELELDRCLVKTVQCRHRMRLSLQSLFCVSESKRLLFVDDLRDAMKDCLEVDSELRRWPMNLPSEYDYLKKENPDAPISTEGLFYSGTVHIYNGLEYAIAWNRWRGCRLIINGLMSKALTWILSISDPTSTAFGANSRLAEIKATTHQMADDVCASVPFHFGILSPTAFAISPEDAIADVPAIQMYALVWPSTLISGTADIPDVQRLFVKNILSTLGHILGSGLLLTLSKMDLHKHSTLVKMPNGNKRAGG